MSELIESLIRRAKGTRVTMGNTNYHFRPDAADRHVAGDVVEDRRSEEESGALHLLAPVDQEPRSIGHAPIHEARDLVAVVLTDERTDLHAGLVPGSDDHLARGLDERQRPQIDAIGQITSKAT